MSYDGAILVVTDPPKGLDFGIDVMTYTTGPEFRGISSIPPGIHFVYYGTGIGARQGFFLRCGKGDLIIRSWDPSTEEITANNVLQDAQVDNLAGAIKRGDLNANLGPYPFDQHRSWKNLSNFISDLVLEQADCLPGVMILPGDHDNITQSQASSMNAVKPYFPDCARVAKFSDIKAVEIFMHEAVMSDTSVPNEMERGKLLSSLHMDRSAIVEKLVLTFHEGALLSLLGELQLSFLLFLVLYSHPALQYWKTCIDLLCNSEGLLKRDALFAQYFLRTLYEQLNFLSDDFFSDELSKDSFLVPAMSALFSALSDSGKDEVDAGTVEHRQRLLAFLKKKFGLFVEKNETLEVARRRECPDSEELLSLWRVAKGQDAHSFTLVEEELPVVVSMTTERVDKGGEDVSVLVEEGKNRVGGGGEKDSVTASVFVQREQQSASSHRQAWATRLDASLSPLSPPSSSQQQQQHEHEPKYQKEMEEAKGDSIPEMDRNNDKGWTSPGEVERARYSWRYPALYDDMEKASKLGVEEDFTMASARLLEAVAGGSLARDSPAAKEALLFLETEVCDKKDMY